MPFVEYMLLVLLGSAPVAPTGGTPSGRTFTAGSITQPSGAVAGDLDLNAGIALVVQDTAGCHGRKVGGTGKKPLHSRTAARRHPGRHHRQRKDINWGDNRTRNAAHKG
jgi:hypothetical protein